MKEIDVLISKDGSTVEIEGKGFEGPECEGVLKKLGTAIGTVEKTENREDFYKKPLQSIRT